MQGSQRFDRSPLGNLPLELNAFVGRSAELARMQVYARLSPSNDFIAARGNEDLLLQDAGLSIETLEGLMGKLDLAIDFLDLLEQEWEAREFRLRFPVRSLVGGPRTQPVGVQLDGAA